MNLRQTFYFTLAVIGFAAPLNAQQAAVAIDNDDIGGVVRGPRGPEAGVWVIAETTELPTKFAKMVVTDDKGRYVIPDLPPNVNYQVWVRGYGLVDSPKQRAKPGQQFNLASPKQLAQTPEVGVLLDRKDDVVHFSCGVAGQMSG